jgi:hypothetical protein
MTMRRCFQLAIADIALARAARFVGSCCKLATSGALDTEGSATGDRSAAFFRLDPLPEASFLDAADLEGVAAAGDAATCWSCTLQACQFLSFLGHIQPLQKKSKQSNQIKNGIKKIIVFFFKARCIASVNRLWVRQAHTQAHKRSIKNFSFTTARHVCSGNITSILAAVVHRQDVE